MTTEIVAKGLRPRVLFLLDENVAIIFQNTGPWIIGHISEVKDLPIDYPGDNLFVIANSRTRVIFGPFKQTKPQRYDVTGQIFYRKEPAISETYEVECHWLMEFGQVSSDYVITKGLPWNELAKLIGVPENTWRSMRKLQLTEAQFETICIELEKFNRDSVLQSSIGQSLYYPDEELVEDYYCKEDTEDWANWTRDNFFDGDQALDDAFWESYDPND